MDIRQLDRQMAGAEIADVFRTALPWAGVTRPPYGASFITLEPASKSATCVPGSDGAMIVFEGEGYLNVEDQRFAVRKGDSVALPPGRSHVVENSSQRQPLTFLHLWWGVTAAPSNTPYKNAVPPRPAFF